MSLKSYLKERPALKKLAMNVLSSEKTKRPRLWVRVLLYPLFMKKGKGTRIARYARLDILPGNVFSLGDRSVVEDFTIINNGVGDVVIGANVFIGASNVIIGPVIIEDDVMTAQHVVFSGMNHGISDATVAYRYQPSSIAQISVGEGSWIGANAVILPGIQIGRKAVVAAGSVVTKNVPEYGMVAGNPARLIKVFNVATGSWDKVGTQ